MQLGILLIAGVLAAGMDCPTASPAVAEASAFLMQTEASHDVLAESREDLLAMRVRDAEQTLQELAERPDGAAAAYHHLATAALLRIFLTDAEEAVLTFDAYTDSLTTTLDRAPETTWRLYLEAELRLQEALAAAKREKHVRAALLGRSAYRRFQTLEAQAPGFVEAYKGRGLLKLAIGSLPKGYQRLLRLLGFRGSIEDGLADLRVAATCSRYNREEALAYLGLTEVLIGQASRQGIQRFATLHTWHPESPLFGYLYGFALLRDRQGGRALSVLQAVAKRGDDAAYLYVDYADYYYAEALFLHNRFADAIPVFQRYAERHPGLALKALTYLHLGLAHEMLGERDRALAYYRAVEASRTLDSDVAAERRAHLRLVDPMTPLDQALLRVRNAFKSGRYAEALALLAPLPVRGAQADTRAEAAYWRARVHHALGHLDEAQQGYQQVLALQQNTRDRFAPWSQLYIAEIHQQQQEHARARAAYEAALAFGDTYDYYQTLEQRAKAALEVLN